jgi:hypothetical protein
MMDLKFKLEVHMRIVSVKNLRAIFLACSVVNCFETYAACVAPKKLDKFSFSFSISNTDGTLASSGVGLLSFTSATSGTCSYTTVGVNGTSLSPPPTCTFALSSFNLTSCSGLFSLTAAGTLAHSGTFVLGNNGNSSFYTGLTNPAATSVPLLINVTGLKQ